MTNQTMLNKLIMRYSIFVLIMAVCFSLAATVSAAPLRQSGSVTDTNIADFNLGTIGSCFAGPSSADGNIDGELTLLPAIATDFSGAALPAGWAQTDTWQPGGGYTVSGGVLTVDNAAVAETANRQGSGQTMEFVATFAAAPYQHIGYGTSFNNPDPWVIFSTGTFSGGDQLYARSSDGQSSGLGAGNLGTHRFRLLWNASSFQFFVDGLLAQTINFTVGAPPNLGPILSDNSGSGGTTAGVLVADWLRMSPYNTSCTFTSRVFDKTSTGNWWDTMASTLDVPAGTSATFRVRFGTTPTYDIGTWTAWLTPAGGTGIKMQEQYLQYEVTLTTASTQFTPVVSSVTLNYSDAPTAVTLQSLATRSVVLDSSTAVTVGLLLAAAAGYIVLRRRSRVAS